MESLFPPPATTATASYGTAAADADAFLSAPAPCSPAARPTNRRAFRPPRDFLAEGVEQAWGATTA